MKPLEYGLFHVKRYRLLGWGPRNYRNRLLETLNDMGPNIFC